MGNIIIHGLNKSLQHTVVPLLFSSKETQVISFFFPLKYVLFHLQVQEADWQKPNLGIGWETPRPIFGSGTHHFSRSTIYSEEDLQTSGGGDINRLMTALTPLMLSKTLPEKRYLHCKATLCDADPGAVTPDTQLHSSQLINTSVLTAPKITPMTWECIPEILNWAFRLSLMETALFIRHWC